MVGLSDMVAPPDAIDVEARQRIDALRKEMRVLRDDQAGRTRDPITDHALTDAKIAASEARTDTKFAQLIGEIRGLQATTSGLQGTIGELRTGVAGIKGTIVGTGIVLFLGLAALMVAVMAYGSGAFYNGTVIRDMLARPVQSIPATK